MKRASCGRKVRLRGVDVDSRRLGGKGERRGILLGFFLDDHDRTLSQFDDPAALVADND